MQIRNFRVVAVGWVFLLLSGTAGAWTLNDDYDNQSVGDLCGSFWVQTHDSRVSSGNSASGSNSCKMSIRQGQSGWGGGVSLPSKVYKGGEFWVRYRLFIPNGFDYGAYSAGNMLKHLRMYFTDTNNKGFFADWEWLREGQVPMYGMAVMGDGCKSYQQCWQFFGTGNQKPNRGVWETYEMYVKVDNVSVDNGGTGRYRIWKNGTLIADLTRTRTINNTGDSYKNVRFFSYWNGNSPKTQFLYFDDLVITDVRPTASDSQGNPYIGMGKFVAVAPPLPPSSIQ